MSHPLEETLKRFASGSASRQENRTVVGHLLRQCPACAAKILATMPPLEGFLEDTYEEPLRRFSRGLLGVLRTVLDRTPDRDREDH